MKRMWILVLMMAALVVGAQDVRGLFWGMTQTEVIAVEGEDTLFNNWNTLAYRRILLEQPATLVCSFVADKLINVGYEIKNTKIYPRLRYGLIERYGKPTSDGPLYCAWFLPRTMIVLKYETAFILLVYEDTVAAEQMMKEQQKQDIGEL